MNICAHPAAARLQPFTSPRRGGETAGGEGAASTIGTRTIWSKHQELMEVSGGVGTIIGFVHDWANPETPAAAGHGGALRGAGDQRPYRRAAPVAEIRDRNRAVFERAGQP